jgi:hypothetical protein
MWIGIDKEEAKKDGKKNLDESEKTGVLLVK